MRLFSRVPLVSWDSHENGHAYVISRRMGKNGNAMDHEISRLTLLPRQLISLPRDAYASAVYTMALSVHLFVRPSAWHKSLPAAVVFSHNVKMCLLLNAV